MFDVSRQAALDIIIDSGVKPVRDIRRQRKYYLKEVSNEVFINMKTKLKHANSRKRVTAETPLEKSRTETQQIKNALLKKKYAPISAMEKIVANHNSKIRTILLSITPLLQRRHNLSQEVLDFVQETLVQAMNTKAVLRLEAEDFADDDDDDENED